MKKNYYILIVVGIILFIGIVVGVVLFSKPKNDLIGKTFTYVSYSYKYYDLKGHELTGMDIIAHEHTGDLKKERSTHYYKYTFISSDIVKYSANGGSSNYNYEIKDGYIQIRMNNDIELLKYDNERCIIDENDTKYCIEED